MKAEYDINQEEWKKDVFYYEHYIAVKFKTSKSLDLALVQRKTARFIQELIDSAEVGE